MHKSIGHVAAARLRPFALEAEKQERRDFIAALRRTAPDELLAVAGTGALAAFRRALAEVPAYRTIVAAHNGGRVPDVATLDEFRRVAPLLDKHNTFGAFDISALCLGGSLEGVRSILTSSGHSGVFSFGVNTAENLQRSARSIDTGLQYLFGVDERSTLMINALPMGVKVNTRATVLAETSVRDDMVYALVKKFGHEVDQIILIAEGSFAKKIIEDGAELHGIDWSRHRIHVITGEEGISENYRAYIERLLGIADPEHPDSQLVMSSMGVAELDLNIFHETRDTIRLRRTAHRDAKLRAALFGEDARLCPMLFVYYPHRTLVEELPVGSATELVISILSEEMKIPLLRYRSGDHGRIHAHQTVRDAARSAGLPEPDWKLPFVWVSGRGKSLPTADGPLFPEAVKEAIYALADVARAVTGNFRLQRGAGDAAELHVQLRRDVVAPGAAEDRLAEAIADYSAAVPRIRFHSYSTFPWAMEVDYERKFRYL
jgi:phenylacetate-CoA ligase